VLFLDGTLDGDDHRDSLGNPAATPLHEAWRTYGPTLETNRLSLREWIALDFFKDVHRTMYETGRFTGRSRRRTARSWRG
jgi:hypothetical protein